MSTRWGGYWVTGSADQLTGSEPDDSSAFGLENFQTGPDWSKLHQLVLIRLAKTCRNEGMNIPISPLLWWFQTVKTRVFPVFWSANVGHFLLLTLGVLTNSPGMLGEIPRIDGSLAQEALCPQMSSVQWCPALDFGDDDYIQWKITIFNGKIHYK